MPRTPLALLALLALAALSGCAAHRAVSDARRAWLDVSLDEPVQLERVLAFLDSYDPVVVGERELEPGYVIEARTWLDNHRREARHWIAEVVAANERFAATDLPQATVDELAAQLVGVVLEMGPVQAEQPGWPAGANPYPWPSDDAELRTPLFGLYLQAGRLCPHASSPIPGCEVEGENLPWVLAAQLLELDPRLEQQVSRAGELGALRGE